MKENGRRNYFMNDQSLRKLYGRTGARTRDPWSGLKIFSTTTVLPGLVNLHVVYTDLNAKTCIIVVDFHWWSNGPVIYSFFPLFPRKNGYDYPLLEFPSWKKQKKQKKKKNGYDFPLLEFSPGITTKIFSGNSISPPPPENIAPPHSRIPPWWKLL